jgi:hypothetical protein
MQQHPSLERSNADKHPTLSTKAGHSHLSTNGDWFWVDIVSATYAPCEEIYNPQYFQCQGSNSNSTTTTPPHLTRDVTPLVRALFIQQETDTDVHNDTFQFFANDESMSMTTTAGTTSTTRWIRLRAVQSGQRRVQLGLLPDTLESDNTALMSMGLNGLFGDPAPGLSKRLHICYRIREDDLAAVAAAAAVALAATDGGTKPPEAPMCTVTFAEHERVYLRHGHWTASTNSRGAKLLLPMPPVHFGCRGSCRSCPSDSACNVDLFVGRGKVSLPNGVSPWPLPIPIT